MAKNVVVHGITYYGKNKVKIPLAGEQGYAIFYDTSGATATSADIVYGKTAFGPGGTVAGGIIDNGPVTGQISTKDETVEVLNGFTRGGSIGIDPEEKAKLISANIKSGVTILGVDGATNILDTSTLNGLSRSDQLAEGKIAFANGRMYVGTGTGGGGGATLATLYYINRDNTTVFQQTFVVLDGQASAGDAIVDESTVAYNQDGGYTGIPTYPNPSEANYYTFIGWNTDPNATEADPNCTRNVTEDRYVYAIYRYDGPIIEMQ